MEHGTIKEYSAGVVIFRRTPEGVKFLLLKYAEPYKPPFEPYWDLPKGHLEPGESAKQAAVREVQEETGLADLKFTDGFEEKVILSFDRHGEGIEKEVTFFLAETQSEKVIFTHPHLDFKWAASEEAKTLIKYEGSLNLVLKAVNKLKANEATS